MAKLLVFDERVSGSPPWEEVSATCTVNGSHSMDSILTWILGKTKKFGGKETLYIMAHGAPGFVQLGKNNITEDNVYKWARLRGRLDWICIIACNVSNVSQTSWNEKKSMWVKGGDGYMLCSQLAGYTKAYVTAADAEQEYFYIPGIIAVTPGSWEGNVYTWAPNGSCHSVGWE